MDSRLQETLQGIAAPDEEQGRLARQRVDNLIKPLGSLGRLEELACRIARVQGAGRISVDPMRIYVVAGDHGVCEEGVSVFPQALTRTMIFNFLSGIAGVNVLAKAAGAEVYAVDAGCLGDSFHPHPRLIQERVANGTANLAKGPAMTRQQCEQALSLGISLADRAAADGVRVVATGEMGIANTTPSTALYCAYFGLAPEEITGPGTGLDKPGVRHKAEVIHKGLQANAGAVASGDGLEILAALGGLEIATLAGLILGGAANGQLVLVDGFISTAAYAAAWRMCPLVAEYSILSHASAEPGHRHAVQAMGLSPVLELGMRLGEGTGCAALLPLLRGAAAMYNDMATFEEAGLTALLD